MQSFARQTTLSSNSTSYTKSSSGMTSYASLPYGRIHSPSPFSFGGTSSSFAFATTPTPYLPPSLPTAFPKKTEHVVNDTYEDSTLDDSQMLNDETPSQQVDGFFFFGIPDPEPEIVGVSKVWRNPSVPISTLQQILRD